jgi:hypothetical protein
LNAASLKHGKRILLSGRELGLCRGWLVRIRGAARHYQGREDDQRERLWRPARFPA